MPLFPSTIRPIPAPHPKLTPLEVVRCIAPHLSEARKKRIEEVIAHRLLGVTLVLEQPYDSHNVAAALRSADAMGLLDVHLIRGDTEFASSRRVTRGAHKWLNVYLHDNTASCLEHLRRGRYEIWAALPPDAESRRGDLLESMPLGPGLRLRRPLALLFGNEHRGLSPQAKAACDYPFHLPMWGFTESYNLSVSVALALGPVVDACRERVGRGDVPKSMRSRLRAAYYARSTVHGPSLIKRHLDSKG